MTIGTITYHPSPQFAFPRSYIFGLSIGQYGDVCVQSAFRFDIYSTGSPPSKAVLVLDPRFFVWSSNRWTLDHVITDWYALSGGVPPQIPLSGTLSYVFDHVRHRATLQFEWYFTSPGYFYTSLPRSPLNYWLPKPLP